MATVTSYPPHMDRDANHNADLDIDHNIAPGFLQQCDDLYNQLWGSDSKKIIESEPESNKKPRSQTTCPVCQEDSIKIDGSMIVCSNCGVEIDDIISDQAEWHNFDDSNRPGKAE